MRYLLGVEVVEDPERKLEINPLDKGSLIHEILERFIAEQIAAGPVRAVDRPRAGNDSWPSRRRSSPGTASGA